MMKWGRAVTPVLVGDSATSAPYNPTIREIRYSVDVAYTTPEGRATTFTGSFLGRNTSTAEDKAREFVIKYKRPRSITGIVVNPA